MKKKKYLLYISVLLLSFNSCSEYEFKTSDQIESEFSKTVTIEDLVYLHKNSSKDKFEKQLKIEGTVVGNFEDYIYLVDNSKYGLRIKNKSSSSLEIGQQISIPVADLRLASEDGFYDLIGAPNYSIIGKGNILSNNIKLEELLVNTALYSSKLVTVSDLQQITLANSVEDGKYYNFISEEQSCVVFIPNSLNYTMPKNLVSVTGFLRIEDSKPIIQIRVSSDIKEVYVEPMMIEKIMNNSTLVKALIQNSEQEVSDGVKMAQISYTNSDGLLTSATIFEIDLNNKNVKIEGGSPNNAAPPFSSIQTLATMAGHKNVFYENSGWRVLMAMTGDFYLANSPYTLNGPYVVNGTIMKSDFTGTTDNFFAVLKDRSGFIVGGRTEFDANRNNIEHAVGGRVILKEGNIVNVPAIREPRTAIGYTTKNKVYMFVGNGRMLSVSNGYSPFEMAELLKALGCEGGLYGNGGGATVGVLESENGSYVKFSESHATSSTHNPSLASSWMIVTKRQ